MAGFRPPSSSCEAPSGLSTRGCPPPALETCVRRDKDLPGRSASRALSRPEGARSTPTTRESTGSSGYGDSRDSSLRGRIRQIAVQESHDGASAALSAFKHASEAAALAEDVRQKVVNTLAAVEAAANRITVFERAIEREAGQRVFGTADPLGNAEVKALGRRVAWLEMELRERISEPSQSGVSTTDGFEARVLGFDAELCSLRRTVSEAFDHAPKACDFLAITKFQSHLGEEVRDLRVEVRQHAEMLRMDKAPEQDLQALQDPQISQCVSLEHFEQANREIKEKLSQVVDNAQLDNRVVEVLAELRAEHLKEEVCPRNSWNSLVDTSETSHVDVERGMGMPTYTLKESVWDACLFLNLGLLDWAKSFTLVFCIVANYMFQFVFVWVAWNMSQTHFTEELVEQMRDWRVMFGHGLQYASYDLNLPLVASVCDQSNRGMQMEGNYQALIYDTATQFVSDGLGPTLCMLAISLWLMSILQEVLAIGGSSSAMWNAVRLDRPQQHLRTTVSVELGKFTLQNVSILRAVGLTVGVTLPRLVIACLLGYTGVLYLLANPDAEELILNAMVLEVVLNVDEVLYASVAPNAVKYMVREFAPLPIPHTRFLWKVVPLLRVVALVSMLAIAFAIEVLPTIHIMERVQQELCDGNINFIARQDLSMRYVVTVGQADGAGDEDFNEQELYRHRATLQATVLEALRFGQQDRRLDIDLPSTEAQRMYRREDLTSVGQWGDIAAQNVIRLAELSRCVDFDDDEQRTESHKRAIRDSLKQSLRVDVAFHSCRDISHLCLEAALGESDASAGNLARLVCPRTCGCAEPFWGQLLASPTYGCPTVCGLELQNRLASTSSCFDRTPSQLGNYTAVFRAEFANYLPPQPMASELGCSFFTSPLASIQWSAGNVSVCNITDQDSMAQFGYRSVRSLCPESCGCVANPGSRECPSGC